ncbi:hypothetical protein KSP39_PZI020349 [Platanthera zijinensis]|uniref:Protein EXORDIUM-like 2 n=1 Tax=Platanthera zijinensis TaxID=2320716 RepID=A0AAP0FX69_9ASPA
MATTSAAMAGTATALLLLLLPPLTLSTLVSTPPLILQYHHGRLLTGDITLHLVWYGSFSPSQRAAVSDFLLSLSSPSPSSPPSVSSWWATTRRYLSSSSSVSLSGRQLLLPSYPLGRSLPSSSLPALASLAFPSSATAGNIAVVLTSADVAVYGFCSGRCGTHANLPGGSSFVWVGDSSVQCPGQCAWPFHQPMYGPQTPPLVPPSGDVGADGIIINIATLLAGTVTNPDGKGYFQGPATAPLEAVSACTGIFGSGAYPGFPGNVLVDPTTGASYNARGVNGREFLLPAMWDPKTSQCATLV